MVYPFCVSCLPRSQVIVNSLTSKHSKDLLRPVSSNGCLGIWRTTLTPESINADRSIDSIDASDLVRHFLHLSPMPVSDEYAARTACRDHTLINTVPQRGTMRRWFLSLCEGKRQNYRCKYSHTIFNPDRVRELGSRHGLRSYVVSLHHGHGFERYGAHECDASGWEVRVVPAGHSSRVEIGDLRVRDLPMALLAEEARAGLKKEGDAIPTYEKVQSLCEAHHLRNGCQRLDCKFDHNLIDSSRIEKLARWAPGNFEYYDALTVECRVVDGKTTWKIILREPAFATLKPTDPIARQIPSRPYSYESVELLDVVRHMEQVVGLAAA